MTRLVDFLSPPVIAKTGRKQVPERPRLFEKLWAISGVRRHQIGDAEMRAVFSPKALEHVAKVIKARRRRSLSPEDARRRGFKPTHGATSGT